mmetsp:Transcript_32188/g.51221  ORF Transcript_32188/g.51221 Transcript_32188/m.51221 type:complete len:599 (-) Transcript_32188:35-1831(-)
MKLTSVLHALVIASCSLVAIGNRNSQDRFSHPCLNNAHPKWEICDEDGETGPDYISECYSFDAPLNWTDRSLSQCNRTTPMYIQRIYPKALNPAHARGHVVMGNPGGPGGSEVSYKPKSRWQAFHNLTHNKFVYYIQKVRGVSQEGSVTCDGHRTMYSLGGVELTTEAKVCLSKTLNKFGPDLALYGYRQVAADLRYTLAVLRNLRKNKRAKISVYAISGGSKLMENYWGIYPHPNDQFDQHIVEGIVTPDTLSLVRTYSEGMARIVDQIFTTCLFRHNCWVNFRELTYYKKYHNGTFSSRKSPVVSVKGLYENLIDTLWRNDRKSTCMSRLEHLANKSNSTISTRTFVASIKYAMYTWTNNVDKRQLFPTLVKMLHTCEFDTQENKAVQGLLNLHQESQKDLTNTTLPTALGHGVNMVTMASQLVSEYMNQTDIAHDIRKITYADMDNTYYDSTLAWSVIRVAKHMLNYTYDYNLNYAKNGRTKKPLLLIQGDYDPLTPKFTHADYQTTWIQAPKAKHQYLKVMPFGIHGTAFHSPTTHRPNYNCGMQLLAAFVWNNGKLSKRDSVCIHRPVFPDYALTKNTTQATFEQVFNITYYN